MKKLIVILLLSFFTAGITSCAVENFDTDPTIDEVQKIDDLTGEEDEEDEGNGPGLS